LRRVPRSAPCSAASFPTRLSSTSARSSSGFTLRHAYAPRIDRFQRSCRARPSRTSLAKRRDELGHPGLSAALERASRSAWGRSWRQPRSLFDRRLLPTIQFPKTGSPLSRHTPRRIPTRPGSSRIHAVSLLWRAVEAATKSFFSVRLAGVPLTLRHRISSPPARCAEVLGARAPNRANVRWCRPAGHRSDPGS
jgi:hypothetical protein